MPIHSSTRDRLAYKWVIQLFIFSSEVIYLLFLINLSLVIEQAYSDFSTF